MEAKRRSVSREEGRKRHLKNASPKGRCLFVPAMLTCLSLVQYLFSAASAPLAMGRSASPAFVTTSANRVRKDFTTTASETRLFFDPRSCERQEHRQNSTDAPMASTVRAGKVSPVAARSGDSSTELSALSSALDISCVSPGTVLQYERSSSKHWKDPSRRRHNQAYKIYCDMDGCLVNFEKGVRTLLHTGSSNLEKKTMWEGISRAPLWFERLEWQMDGRRLWNAIKHLRPDILTGVPDIKSSRVEKFNWCKRELGLEEADAHHVDMACEGYDHESVNGNFPREDKTNIITCWSYNKHKECNRHGSILIDDRIDLKKSWEEAGGIFIHHINTETTIRKLCDLGVISVDQLVNREDEWYWEGSWRLWRIN